MSTKEEVSVIRIIKIFVIFVLLFAGLVTLGFKACEYRRPITPEKFMNYMATNDYYIISGLKYTSGEFVDTVERDGLHVKVSAEIDTLNIEITYLEYESGDKALSSFNRECVAAKQRYFINKANHELIMLTKQSDFVKETSGNNFNRYIVRSPDQNCYTIVSRIENTLIVVRDTPDISYYKVRDSLGNIGY